MLTPRWFVYTTGTLVAPESTLQENLGVKINGMKGPFYLRGVSMLQNDGNYRVRLHTPNGSTMIQDRLISSQNIETNGNRPCPCPIWPGYRYIHDSQLIYDLENVSAAAPDNLTELLFVGQHGDDMPLDFPSADVGTPYQLGLTLTIAANARVSVPVRLPFDRFGFQLRTLNWTVDGSGFGDYPSNLRVKLLDDNGQAFMNDYVNARLLFQSSVPALPGLVNPMPVIPPYGSYRLDLVEAGGQGPVTLQFKFGGMLLDA